jgi:hypothetical protein
MTNDPRTGRAWMNLITQCKSSYPWICHLCNQPIPRGLPAGHNLHFEADHVTSVDECRRTGRLWLILDIRNLRPSHRQCNQYRGKRKLTPALKAEIRARYTPTQPALTFFQGNP